LTERLGKEKTSLPVWDWGQDPLARFQLTHTDPNGIYFGAVAENGDWLIIMDTEIVTMYAMGSGNYLDNWNNKENLEYKYFYEFG
jgi:hypothetical protein